MKGVVLAHYTPKLLPPPKTEVERVKKELKIDIPWEELAKAFETAAEFGLQALLILGEVGLTLLSLLAFVDPYIAVLVENSDGSTTWIKVYEWVE